MMSCSSVMAPSWPVAAPVALLVVLVSPPARAPVVASSGRAAVETTAVALLPGQAAAAVVAPERLTVASRDGASNVPSLGRVEVAWPARSPPAPWWEEAPAAPPAASTAS